MRTGQVGARPMMDVTISAERRVIDSMSAAEIPADIKRVLENPVVLIAS